MSQVTLDALARLGATGLGTEAASMLEQQLDTECAKLLNQVGVGVGWAGVGKGGGGGERECKGIWVLAIKEGRTAPFRFRIISSQSLNAKAAVNAKGFVQYITHHSFVIKDKRSGTCTPPHQLV